MNQESAFFLGGCNYGGGSLIDALIKKKNAIYKTMILKIN